LPIKVGYQSPDLLKEDFDSAPERKVGRWDEVCEQVKKTGKAANITGLTRGQAWSLKRTATNAGLEARVLEKGTRVVIMPPAKSK